MRVPLLLLPAALALGACGGEPDDRPHSLTYLQDTIRRPSCATGTCHVTANENLDPATPYPAFDDRATLHEIMLAYSLCDALGCISDGSPIIDHLIGNGLTRMPPDEPIPDANIELIRAWIDDGAEDN